MNVRLRGGAKAGCVCLPVGERFPLACSAAAPSRLRHALSSVRLLRPLHWGQDAHFAAEVIANSLEGALLRVSLVTVKPAGSADPSDCERSELWSEGDGARAGETSR